MKKLLIQGWFCILTTLVLADERPNVLVIVADDLGYADLGFQGCKDIPTPNLDALAASGIRCTNGYVSHPFCSPTRAGLLTGRYQHRFGHENNPAYLPDDPKSGLPLDQITLPEMLKKAGYATGMVGKWHLGAHPSLHPNRRGFEEYFGFIGGGHLYDPAEPKGGDEYKVPLQFNGEPRPFDRYLTDILGREAAAYVDRHASSGKPWFLYLAFNAPHTPLSAPKELLEKFSSIQDEHRRTYAAMVHSMDAAVGETLKGLEKTRQRENTLVFFVSDNGGPHLSRRNLSDFTNNSPLRGAKGDMYEGGIRVPFLVCWPKRLKPGLYEKPVIALDFFATAAAMGGGKVPNDRKMDSVNLLPYLTGETAGNPHEVLFWRSQGPGGNYAVREGDWKLVRNGSAPAELYNLSSDVGETGNLAAQRPDKVQALTSLIDGWEKETKTPVFGGPKQGPARKKKAK